MEQVRTGSEALDTLLDGGFEPGIISTVYGPSGSGKTNIVLMAAVTVAQSGKKVIFIDTEGGYSVERLRQLCDAPRAKLSGTSKPGLDCDAEKVLGNIMFLQPTTYNEQLETISKLPKLVNEKIGLIVLDSAAMLYRLELGSRENPMDVNRELGLQFSYLTQIARTKNIPVLVTTQVYSLFDEREKVALSGGDLVRYASKCLIELQVLKSGRRRALIKKHRHLPEDKDVFFEIVNEGLKTVTPGKGFVLFGKE
jgi:DNA repair protein RadB